MKFLNSKSVTLAAMAAAVLLCVAPAHAQADSVRFNIPFSFVAGGQILPAGAYDVTVDNQFSRVLLRNVGQSKVYGVVMTSEGGARTSELSTAQLRFTRHSGTLFLSAAWAPGRQDGKEVAVSHKAIEAGHKTPAGAASESVVLNPEQR